MKSKRKHEDSVPFLYEGGGDDGANNESPPADNEAGGDKKEEITDEEAIQRAIARNKEIIERAKRNAAM